MNDPQPQGAKLVQSEPVSSGPRYKVVKLPGTKLAKEKERTMRLARTLPRRIRLGEYKDGRGKPYFVRWGKPRKVESFALESDRNDRAEALRDVVATNGQRVIEFDPKEWAEFQAWRDARGKLLASGTAKEMIAKYLELRAGEDMSPDSYSHIKKHLGRFAEFDPKKRLVDVDADFIREWLDDLKTREKLGPASRRHHRKDLSVFFARAVLEKWVTENPVKAVAVPKVAVSDDVAVMALKDAFTFFKVNREQRAVGRLALEAFAGLRFSSAARAVKQDLDFANRGIVMPGPKHKTRRRHYVDGWPKNLWRWLAHAPEPGWTITPRVYANDKAFAFARANVKNPGNVFRHTFATMHLAAFKEIGALATLLTHRNLNMLMAHYRGRGVPQAIGRAYFKITPKTVLLSWERFCALARVPKQTDNLPL